MGCEGDEEYASGAVIAVSGVGWENTWWLPCFSMRATSGDIDAKFVTPGPGSGKNGRFGRSRCLGWECFETCTNHSVGFNQATNDLFCSLWFVSNCYCSPISFSNLCGFKLCTFLTGLGSASITPLPREAMEHPSALQ
jgi:hypothetical protein